MAREYCNIEGIAEVWDSCQGIRDNLRAGMALLSEMSEKNVDMKTPIKYHEVIKPVLARMQQSAKKMPSVDDLREEITRLLELSKRDPEAAEVDKCCWLMRKQCGYIKMRCRRLEVSTVSLLHKNMRLSTA